MAFSPSRSGQSVIEVLIAIFILASMSTAAFVLLSSTFVEGLVASERTRAEDLLTNGFEAVRQIRDTSFDNLDAGTHGLSETDGIWTFSGSEDVTNAFHRSVDITTIDDATREVTVAVTWTNRLGRTEERAVTTRLTNWRTPMIPAASNCYGYTVTGDWMNPIVIGNADIGAGNQGTDVVVNLPYAYVSGVAASSGKPDLFVFDVSVPTAPMLVSSVDVGAGGMNTLSISGDYLYAASPNDDQEFLVFDVSDPRSPSLVAHTNPTGSADGLTVIVKGSLAVLGRSSSTNSEIYFYDVTDPTVPSLLATFETDDSINDFATNATHVFAAGDSSAEGLTIFDVTNPLVPIQVSATDIGEENKSIAYNEPGTLFVGQEDALVTVDVADPTAPIVTAAVATGTEIKDMVCTSNNLLFTGTDSSTKEFIALDISDLNALSEYSSLNFPQVVSGIDFAANMVFAAVRSNDALRIITSSP